jgi:hypothetical protein
MARPPRSSRSQPRSSPPPARPRRAPFAIAIVLLVAGAVAVAWQYLRPVPPGAVVLISIDTLRADHLPVYGYTKGRTPVLDGFAKESVVFDRAYSHAPQTLPAHTSMLTGLLPFEHGVRDNLGFTLAADKTTLAERFRRAGYKTGGFISAYVLRPETGIGRGFDDNADPPAVAWTSPGSPAAGRTSPPVWLNTSPPIGSFSSPSTSRTRPTRARAGSPLALRRRSRLWTRSSASSGSETPRRMTRRRSSSSCHGRPGDRGEFEHGLFVTTRRSTPWIMKPPGAKSAGVPIDSADRSRADDRGAPVLDRWPG